MPDAPVVVTESDMDRLTGLIRAFKDSLFRDQQQLEMLDQKLAAAEVRPSGRVPKDVIRMNSRVRVFDCESHRRGLYTLTFPDEADVARGMISILAPLGIALLGRRQGDVIEAHVPGRIRKLRVDAVREMRKTRPSEDHQIRLKRLLLANHEPTFAA